MSARLLTGLLLCVLTTGSVAQTGAPPEGAERIQQLVDASLDASSPDRAQVLGERALEAARQAGDERGIGRSLYALAYARYHQGDAGTESLFGDAARAAHRARDPRTEGIALAWEGMVIGDRDAARGEEIGRQAIAVHEAIPGDEGRTARLVSLNMLANQLSFSGDTDGSARLNRRILREAQALGDDTSIGLAALSLGDYALARGDLVDALAQYATADVAARQSEETPGWITDVEAGQARVEAALGQVDLAAATLRRLAEAEARQGQAGYASGYYLLLGEVYHDAGRTADAVQAFEDGYSVMSGSDVEAYRFEFRVLEAAALFDAGRVAEARRLLRPAADSVVANPPGPGAEALALTLLARDARLDGRALEAAALAERAITVAERARLVRHARDAYAERASALEAAGDPAGALVAFRRAASLSDSLRSVEQARAVGRLQAEATFERDRAAQGRTRTRLTWGLMSVLGLGALTVFGGGTYLRTVRRKNTEIGRQAQELASANADLAQTNAVVREARETQARFFQTASHELRTPLTLTLGPLDDLLRETHGPISGAARHAADLAHTSASRLGRLVDDLLDAARLDAGQTPHRPSSTDLCALVAETTHRFQSHAERAGVALEVALPSDPVPAVLDAATIERSLANLVANAIRHTPQEGRVEVALTAADGWARIAVADTGPGVDEDAVPHLFERFYRSDERGTGSGLGLALTKEWAERHGGRVEVESAPDRGSTFTLVLPLPATPLTVLEVGLPVLEDDALLVLVAEDHDDLRAYIASHLERDLGEPTRVVQAADGDTALALALEVVPDLIVSDVMMPGLDGFALTRALRADRRTSHVPILLLTARADAPGTVEGFEAGADGYLAKPFDADVLRAQASALITERRRLLQRLGTGGDGLDGTDSQGSEPEPPSLPPADRRFLEDVDAAIAENLSNTLFGAETLAEALALSPRQFRRKLRAVAADSPIARLRRARVDAAEVLLEDGLSISEAANAVGYADSGGLRRALAAVRGERG